MRKIYLLASLGAIMLAAEVVASAVEHEPGSPGRVPAGQGQGWFIQDKNVALLKQLESMQLLEKRQDASKGLLETMEAMTGANVQKNGLSDLVKGLPKTEQSERLLKLLGKNLKDRHDIYKEIYDRYGAPVKPLPVIPYEQQLKMNLDSIKLVQSQFQLLLSKEPGVKIQDQVRVNNAFKSMNLALELQYENLLIARR